MPWVQGNSTIAPGGTHTYTITLGQQVAVGNCVVVGVWTSNGNTHPPAGVTDDKGNTYLQSDQLVDGPNGAFLTTYYLGNITNRPTTLTIDMGVGAGANFFGAAIADEYSGILRTADPRDGHAINLQGSATAGTDHLTSGNITTTINGDTIWGYTVNTQADGTVGAAGTGFTLRETSAGGGHSSEDTRQALAGTTAATFSIGTNNPYLTAVIALKPAVPGPVQSNNGHSSSGPFITLPNPVSAGNCLVVAVYTQSLQNSISVSLTDDKGNVYHLSDQVDDGTFDDNCLSVFYLSNITNGPTALTVHTGGGTGFASGCADEFSGVSRALDPRDGHSSHSANSTGAVDGITSGNITTAIDGDIIYCATLNAESLSPEATAGTGFTHLSDDTSGDGVQTEYLIQPTAGTIAGTWSFVPFTPFFLTIALALKPAIGKMKQQKAYTQNVIKDQ